MKPILILPALAIVQCSFCQHINLELVTSSGSIYSTEKLQMSWSVGEVISDTYKSNAMIISHGFQQVFDIATARNEIQADKSITSVRVYPNPTQKDVNIVISKQLEKNSSFLVKITNLQGKQLLIYKTKNTQFRINLEDYMPGIYLLSVSENGKQNHLFKIIKSN